MLKIASVFSALCGAMGAHVFTFNMMLWSLRGDMGIVALNGLVLMMNVWLINYCYKAYSRSRVIPVSNSADKNKK